MKKKKTPSQRYYFPWLSRRYESSNTRKATFDCRLAILREECDDLTRRWPNDQITVQYQSQHPSLKDTCVNIHPFPKNRIVIHRRFLYRVVNVVKIYIRKTAKHIAYMIYCLVWTLVLQGLFWTFDLIKKTFILAWKLG